MMQPDRVSVPNRGEIDRLVAHLASHPITSSVDGWEISQPNPGGNNLVFRARRGDDDVAVKFTVRDERRRAWREYQSQTVLRRSGLAIAPVPVMLDESSSEHPVVVSSWIGGDVDAQPPSRDQDWESLLDHLLRVFSVAPETTHIEIPEAVNNANGSVAAGGLIDREVNRFPREHASDELRALVSTTRAWLDKAESLRPEAVVLCRNDPTPSNFIRRPSGWASVDWENAGWGDPAFEIADLLCHPRYIAIPIPRRHALVDGYVKARRPANAHQRIAAYETVLLVWWVARLERSLWEVPRGRDKRLVDRGPGWLKRTRAQVADYRERAFRSNEEL